MPPEREHKSPHEQALQPSAGPASQPARNDLTQSRLHVKFSCEDQSCMRSRHSTGQPAPAARPGARRAAPGERLSHMSAASNICLSFSFRFPSCAFGADKAALENRGANNLALVLTMWALRALFCLPRARKRGKERATGLPPLLWRQVRAAPAAASLLLPLCCSAVAAGCAGFCSMLLHFCRHPVCSTWLVHAHAGTHCRRHGAQPLRSQPRPCLPHSC